MGMDSIWHWAILLLVVLLVFGTGKIARIGGDVGGALRDFKKALRDKADDSSEPFANSHERCRDSRSDNT